MLNKILLVREAASSSTLTDKLNISKFVQGKPLNISPRKWGDESGLSHYGYVLKGMKLGDVKELEKWITEKGEDNLSLIDLVDLEKGQKAALDSVGLRINESV